MQGWALKGTIRRLWPRRVVLCLGLTNYGILAVCSMSLQPILALLGHPVAGNPTQYVIQKAFRQLDLDWRYLTLDVAPDDLGDAVRGMRAMGFRGGNCAEPHKEAIIAHLDHVTRTASLAGAVNLICRQDSGLVGENTEGRALLEALRQRIDPAGKRVVLLGAGRMARAVAVELAQAGVAELVVVNRTAARAADLVEMLTRELQASASAMAWEGMYQVPSETDVLIHATSIADGQAEATLPLAPESLAGRPIVADACFNPPDTWLLAEARRRGCTTLDGLEVFIRQIVINLTIWTGQRADTAAIREAVEEFLGL